MKSLLSAACLLLALSLVAADRPNVVIIYGDDVGIGDVGVYGSEKIPTPHIDRIANEGLRFTDGHCTAATCTPSRFSLLTGVYGFRHGVRILPPNAPMSIPTDILTMPKLFKKAGYNTAVVGKWHLGLGDGKTPVDWNGDVKPGPLELGFDYSFLLPSTNDRVPCVYVENHRVVNLDPKDPLYVNSAPEGHKSTVYPYGRDNPEAETYYEADHQHSETVINGIGRIGKMWGGKSALWNDETMADEFVNRAITYIGKQSKDTPFFLYLSSQDIHVPRAPHPRFKGKTKLGHRGDAMVQFDWTCGAVMEALEKRGMAENTIFIVSSDNGPVYDDGYKDGSTVWKSSKEADLGHDGSGVWRGGKYQIYEGGTRVPFIVKWPAKIKPAVSDALVSQIDFMASFAKMLDIPLADSEAVDSRNTLDTFLGTDKTGLTFTLQEAGKQVAIRHNNWKFIPAGNKQKQPQLYDLSKDKGEKNNVAKANPELVTKLAAQLKAYRQGEHLRSGTE
jgi:arylsulfatase A-like enzyme